LTDIRADIRMHDFSAPVEPDVERPEWISWLTLWLCAALALDLVAALAVTDFGPASAIAEGIVWLSLGTVMFLPLFCHVAALVVSAYGLVRSRGRQRLPIVRMVLSAAGVSVWIGLSLLS
jgi:hypothetical protein